jgi:predicted HTH transcriptional regulator
MISQDNSGEKNSLSPKLKCQTKLETLVNVLDLLYRISPSTLDELSSKKRISNKNMETHLDALLDQGLISKIGQSKKLTTTFLLNQQGINVLIYFKSFQKKRQIEFISEEKKWAISKLVVRN